MKFYCRMCGGKFDPDPEHAQDPSRMGGAGRTMRTLCDHYDIDFFSPKTSKGAQDPERLSSRACKSFLQIQGERSLSIRSLMSCSSTKARIRRRPRRSLYGENNVLLMAYQSSAPGPQSRRGDIDGRDGIRIPVASGYPHRERSGESLSSEERHHAEMLPDARPILGGACDMGLFFREVCSPARPQRPSGTHSGDVEEFKRPRVRIAEEYAANIVPDIWEGPSRPPGLWRREEGFRLSRAQYSAISPWTGAPRIYWLFFKRGLTPGEALQRSHGARHRDISHHAGQNSVRRKTGYFPSGLRHRIGHKQGKETRECGLYTRA